MGFHADTSLNEQLFKVFRRSYGWGAGESGDDEPHAGRAEVVFYRDKVSIEHVTVTVHVHTM